MDPEQKISSGIVHGLRIPKGFALAPHLGFVARDEEVRQIRGSARKIKRILERRVDSRSFVEVTKGGVRDRRHPPP